MRRLLPLCLACLLPSALAAPAAVATTPNYIREAAARYQLDTATLWHGSDTWPWLVWRDNQPIRLRDQRPVATAPCRFPRRTFARAGDAAARTGGARRAPSARAPITRRQTCRRRQGCRRPAVHSSLLCRTHQPGIGALRRLAAAHQRGHRQRECLPKGRGVAQGGTRADAGDAGYRPRDGLRPGGHV